MLPVKWNPGLPPAIAGLYNVLRFRRGRIAVMEELAEVGDFVQLRFGSWNAFFVAHPDLVKEVLVNQAKKVHKGPGLERAQRILGTGLVTSEDELHHRQRRLMQPAFARQRLQSYGSAMVELTARHRERFRDGEERDLHLEMMRLTLAIVAKTLFDSDIEDEASEVGQAADGFLHNFDFLLLPGSNLLQKLPLRQVRELGRSRATFDRVIYRLIDERRQSGRDHGDLLSMLLLATDEEDGGRGMSNEQLRDECVTILLAGHETTANALTWTLYLLSQHPNIEARLLADIDRVLGGRLPTPADLPQLAYVEQVVAESLRLYPAVYMVARRVIEPLNFDGFTVPSDSFVGIPIWSIHRDRRHYPEPLRFDPERFSATARAGRNRFTYLPFSHGPRNCIGEHFAWMEAVLLLTTLLQRFQFRLAPGQKVEPQPVLTLRPKHGMRMRVSARPSRVLS
jgi:cytochrome P450